MKYAYTNIIFRFNDTVYEKRLTLLNQLNICIYGIGNRQHGRITLKQMKDIFYSQVLVKMRQSINQINPGL